MWLRSREETGELWGGGVKRLPKKSEKMAELRFAC